MDIGDVLLFIGGVCCALITLFILCMGITFAIYLGNPDSENALIRVWRVEPGQEWAVGFVPAGIAAGLIMFGFTAYILIDLSLPAKRSDSSF